MNTKSDQTAAPIACNLSDPELARWAAELERDLFSAVAEVEELPDGYAYRFPAAPDWIDKLIQFIAFERQCCPFFTFELVFEPNQGPVWLRLRGSDEIKAFVAQLHPSGGVS
ncbi:MAG: hypothetical protein ACRDJW_24540 [Thermomicrobiales bacterium]